MRGFVLGLQLGQRHTAGLGGSCWSSTCSAACCGPTLSSCTDMEVGSSCHSSRSASGL